MPEVSHSRYLVNAGWSDVPHLSAEAKRDMRDSTPPYLRDAREHGTPSLGSGAIYPIPLEEILCDPFQVPHYYKRAFALDVGWSRTAAVWGAEDPTDKTLYLYAEHYQGQQLPVVHAAAIRQRGAWIPGVIDPAARGRSQRDGEQIAADYRSAGLNLQYATNAVEAGIYEVWSGLMTGQIKVFRTLQNWVSEYRFYRRDKNGKIVKKNDHLMDATRYLRMDFGRIATVRPPEKASARPMPAADSIAGY